MESIQPNAWVLLDYTLRDADGTMIEASSEGDGEPLAYVHGYGMIVPGLEEALVGLKKGDHKRVVVPPAAAFGDHDEELVIEVDRGDLPRPDEVCAGDELVAEDEDGDETAMRVLEVREDSVVLDANHPLAGKELHYEVTVRDVREATMSEIAEVARAFEEAGYGDDPEPQPEGGALVQLGRRPAKDKGPPN